MPVAYALRVFVIGVVVGFLDTVCPWGCGYGIWLRGSDWVCSSSFLAWEGMGKVAVQWSVGRWRWGMVLGLLLRS